MYKEVDRVERLTFYVPKMLPVMLLWVFLLICLFCPISLCFLESCTNEFFCENTTLNFEFVARHLQFQDIGRIEERKTTIMVFMNPVVLDQNQIIMNFEFFLFLNIAKF